MSNVDIVSFSKTLLKMLNDTSFSLLLGRNGYEVQNNQQENRNNQLNQEYSRLTTNNYDTIY